MKKLGFGFMRLPVLDNEDRTKIDYETVNKMVDLFMENGFTYFDTAKVYHDGFSEIAIGKCLADRYPRDSFRLTDKLSLWVVDSPDKMQEFFNGQLEACHVDYFDNYLIHNMGVKTYKQAKDYDAFNFVRKLKEQGKVKEFGFSFHDNADFLDIILTEQPDVDYVQLQVNYMDWNNSGIQSRKCCEVASKHGKKIIIMEPVIGGTLANVPKKAAELLSSLDKDASVASWAIRFAASVKDSVMVLSGMSSMEQVNDNIGYMKDFTPLSPEETKAVYRVVDIINEVSPIPCTGCRYCVEGCPAKVSIPECFSLYNADLQYMENFFSPHEEIYGNIPDENKASACLECGLCEEACPQHLKIRELLKDVAKRFE